MLRRENEREEHVIAAAETVADRIVVCGESEREYLTDRVTRVCSTK